jgi:mannosyl-3-phosphoglycerate phosphatase
LKPKAGKIVIFSDLDGSLLNDAYSYLEIEPTLRHLLSLNVSIVLASSKTRSEIEFYREKLGIFDPFIVENGSAIFVPENYFKAEYRFTKQTQSYNIIELGSTYQVIREKLALVRRRTGASFVGFGDMSVEEIAKDSGLPLSLARLAKKREYSEPFKMLDRREKDVLQAIAAEGLCYTKGDRYFHVLGSCDKGKATKVLRGLYLQEFDKIIAMGVGDSPNDLPMLRIVDKPFYVRKAADRKGIWKEIELCSRLLGDR